MGLLSSTGSAAAALTLNSTPMRAANTTRSCMLWQENRWPTNATVTGAGCSQRVCEWVCLRRRVRAAQTSQRSSGGVKVQCSWWRLVTRFETTNFSSALPPKSPTLLYASPPVCHWRTGWWVYDEEWRVYVCMVFCGGGVCARAWKRRGDEGVRTQQMEPSNS